MLGDGVQGSAERLQYVVSHTVVATPLNYSVLAHKNSRQTGCPYVSGILILLVNMCELPTNEFVEHDKELIRYSLSVFDKMSENTALLQMKRLRSVISELDRLATQAVERAKETPVSAGWEQPLEGTRSLDHLPVTFVIGESWADCVGAPSFFPDEPSPVCLA